MSPNLLYHALQIHEKKIKKSNMKDSDSHKTTYRTYNKTFIHMKYMLKKIDISLRKVKKRMIKNIFFVLLP